MTSHRAQDHLGLPDVPETPDDEDHVSQITKEPLTKKPRNRVFGYLSVAGELIYATLGSNPSRAHRAARRFGLTNDHVLWEFVMTRQVKHDDAATIARRLLKRS
jgi:hypothetical protein